MVKKPLANEGDIRDVGLIPGSGRSPGGGNSNLLLGEGRRERLPTPVFWPGEFHELYSLWGHKELDMTERLSLCFPVFLPGESREQRSLEDYSPWGHKESGTTDVTWHTQVCHSFSSKELNVEF